MKKPSKGLLKSMYQNNENYARMEKLFQEKYKLFMDEFSSKLKAQFFPWYHDLPILTPYNTIKLPVNNVQPFLEFFNDYNVSVILNPTYKCFNFQYENDVKDRIFNDGIVYLPSVANMKPFEIKILSDRIKEFYESHLKF